MAESEGEAAFALALRGTGHTVVAAKEFTPGSGAVAREYRFAAALGRQWRNDFAMPDIFFALEIEGGIGKLKKSDTANDPGGNRWSAEQYRAYQRSGAAAGSERIAMASGHVQSPEAYEADAEKYHTAMVLGWWVVRVTSRQVFNGEALELWDAMTQLRRASISSPDTPLNAGILPWFQPSLFRK